MSLFMKIYVPLDKGARRLLLAGVHLYQRRLGWLLGGHCRFVPSCSFYAEEALQRGPLLPALWLITWRLLRCQPFGTAGEDPVPVREGGEKWFLNLNKKRTGHEHCSEHDEERGGY